MEFVEVKQMHLQEAHREKRADEVMYKLIKQIAVKQYQMIETQNAQGKIIERIQEQIVQDLE